ncbi:hypothetical protein PVAND_002928 [Polypedilum vanderplanki]|uniref:Lipase domain-containing protein n=1 Tax=Polypedilum vanderplanki TaxID=319348 RepID=A0A9J6BSL9_POLVA|nr:hypothetical protein PVAND_002928 [Polypedilum vanderplanki]
MKLILTLSFVLIGGAYSLPIEEKQQSPRWAMVPNQDGRMHFVDLNEIEADPEPLFDPARDIVYILFTRRNPTEGQILTEENIRDTNWNPSASVRLIIHGWQSDRNTALNIFIREELLASADHNVIVVDWSAGAQTINYAAARNRVGITGGTIAQFLNRLHINSLINLDNIIVIGHSLGSHVAANIGKQLTRGRLTAIFGTDPAGPLFSAGDTVDRLATEDAIYTEAIHTNAGNLGFDEPITHSSFYPNWGSSQPGCGIDLTGACAHERSNLFYAESVRSARFVARQCSGYQQILARNCPGIGSGIMGGDIGKSLRGVFFLQTNSASPFAQG